MPCYDGRSDHYANLTMRFTCETLSAMVARGEPIPDYLKDWWRDHQEWDAEQGRPHTLETHNPPPKRKRKD